jgi:alpha-mannosidase
MELYPFYRFMMPQVKLYRMAGEACPALLERIRGRLAEGRWEISGMMYLESDTNLPRGEWLVRNLLLGREVCRGLGQAPHVESLIDAFGYSGNMPQIFAKSGIDWVMLTKMMWYNDTNKFPYSAFNWRGVDGTSVLVATMPWFNRPCGPGEVAANVERLKQKDVLRDVPVFFGWGDGGGGADENHLEMLARDLKWNRPARVVAGRLDEFFEKLSETRDRLPSWWGEVYQEGHRGCYTTQARHKKLNRASESLYRSLEWFMGLEQWQGGCGAGVECGAGETLASQLPASLTTRRKLLAQNVERIVTNQFHDTLSGSAANRVYADSAAEYEKILGEGAAWQSETLGQLAGRIDTRGPGRPIVLWNLHGFSRPALVEMDWSGPANGTLTDGAGKEVPCQVRDGKLMFVAKDLPQFGYCVYRFAGGKSPVSPAAEAASANRVENDRLVVEWNADGQLTRMFSKTLHRELLRPRGLGNKLVLYFDYPFSCDAWDLDADYRRHPQVLNAKSFTVHPREAICQRVTFEYATDRSTIRQTMVLYDGLDRVQFVTQADWHERHRLLKAHFDSDVQASFATYDIPFGAIQRDTRHNDTWQQAKFEVPGVSLADLSEPGAGVAIVSPHKSGFAVLESDMSVSLLRSSTFPDEQADQGRHEFSYSVLGHEGDFARGGVVQESRLLLNPVVAQAAEPHGGDLPACRSFLQIDRPNVVVETLKAAEDGNGLVLRVYEAQGQRETATVSFALPVREIQECNLMEEAATPASFANGQLTFDIRPFEIKSFRLTV